MTTDWKSVWDRKASTYSGDQFDLSGFENARELDTEVAAGNLCHLMGAKPGDSILEIGCAGGLLVKKTIELNSFSAVCCGADNIIFKDESFDYVFAFSVFHYFPDFEYARRAISEMKRVARKAICVSDVPVTSHDSSHLIYTVEFFAGWQISGGLYPREHERFTATIML
jgi:ubiquinone/menaquinone biosynthesis C-methylase UbiE